MVRLTELKENRVTVFRLENPKYFREPCAYCGREFIEGDMIVRIKYGRSFPSFYHRLCFNKRNENLASFDYR